MFDSDASGAAARNVSTDVLVLTPPLTTFRHSECGGGFRLRLTGKMQSSSIQKPIHFGEMQSSPLQSTPPKFVKIAGALRITHRELQEKWQQSVRLGSARLLDQTNLWLH